ncbi:peptide deformylase [Allobacillus sp. GCM10007491]|uniref:Peptide deformylase n=1 Tax=Allobacillus saliphilus TaxID=2912308 RepID=A0A941HSB6_9BACI|nr:peptide deformylase [Allobacillus saliphilus]MBR7553526.1 peptide deformylase [Allobacillus saliphilus]
MLTMKDIVREGHESLRIKATKVNLPATEEEKELLTKMLQFIKNSQDEEMIEKYDLRSGVGLAAPQLGISKRMIAVHFSDHNERLYSYGLFNPRIISHSVEQTYLPGGEGCLSVDRDVPGIVPRYARITVKATTLEGEDIKLRLKGYAAVVFQHEIDHLNGVMFYDHIDKNDPMTPPDNAVSVDEL